MITQAAFENGLTPELAAMVFQGRSVYLVSLRHAPVKLLPARVNGVNKLVVAPKDNLTFSIEAWKSRAVLRENYRGDILSQSRVIIFSDNPTTKAYFQSSFGKRALHVSNPKELNRALDRSKNHFVVVVGHVEESSFVLKEGNKVLMKSSLDDVTSKLNQRQSSSLLLGCDISCKTGFSGPSRPINMRDMHEPLLKSLKSKNESELLVSLTGNFAPMHIEKDVFNNLVSVKAQIPFTKKQLVAGSVISYGVLGGTRDHLTPADKTIAVAIFPIYIPLSVLFALIYAPFLWIFAVLVGPKKVWKNTKSIYAESLGYENHTDMNLGFIEKAVLAFIAPSVWYVRWGFMLLISPVWFILKILKWGQKTFQKSRMEVSSDTFPNLTEDDEPSSASSDKSVDGLTSFLILLTFSLVIAHLVSSWMVELIPYSVSLPSNSNLTSIISALIMSACWLEISKGRGLVVKFCNLSVKVGKGIRDLPLHFVQILQWILRSLRLSHVTR